MIDDDSTSDETIDNPNTQRVGKRLAIIREELGNYHGGQDWSQTAVGLRIGLTQNIITRMEHGKGGLMENWLKVLNFYAQQGYNLHWILIEDNKHVSKLLINDTTIGQVRDELLDKISGLRTQTLKGIKELHNMVLNVPHSADTPSRPGPPEAPDLSFLA